MSRSCTFVARRVMASLLMAVAVAACSGAADGPGTLDDAGAPDDAGRSAAAAEMAPAWVELFDGASLAGWTPKIRGQAFGEDLLGTFRVEDGLLTVSYEAYDTFDDQFGHLFYESPFSQYRLLVEYRFTGDQAPGGAEWALRNSGVMVHAQEPASMTVDQDFPISVEVQFLGGNGTDPRPTANLCTPGTHVHMDGALVEQHCVESSSVTIHGDAWVTVEVVVRGNESITHLVNGDTVLAYQEPVIGGGVVNGFDPAAKPDGASLSGGWIALQSESHPVQFRRVAVREIAPGP